MLVLTCRSTGQPVTVNPLRLSSVVPHPDGPGSMIRTMEGLWVPVSESAGQIVTMLQTALEPASAPEADAVKTAASMLRQLAELIGGGHGFTAGNIGYTLDEQMGLSDAGWQDTAEALRALADRLEKR